MYNTKNHNKITYLRKRKQYVCVNKLISCESLSLAQLLLLGMRTHDVQPCHLCVELIFLEGSLIRYCMKSIKVRFLENYSSLFQPTSLFHKVRQACNINISASVCVNVPPCLIITFEPVRLISMKIFKPLEVIPPFYFFLHK